MFCLEQDRNISNVYTGVYPYWTDADGGNMVVCNPKIIQVPGKYDFINVLPVDFSQDFEDKPTPAQLKARTDSYIKANRIGIPKVSITASFVQLEQTEEYKHLALLEKCDLCDTVTIQFEQLGIDAKAEIVKIETDVLEERYISVEIGEARTNIADTIAGQQQTVDRVSNPSYIAQAASDATKLITGGKGGYVVMRSSTGGTKPDEILIMDTPDITTAKKVWRWNQGGLGYSKTGYNGPYGLAMTQDGAIVADFITAGTLNAAQVKVINLVAEGVKLTGNFRTISGNYFADLWAGVFKLGRSGAKDHEYVGVSSSSKDPDNGSGIINVWVIDDGQGKIGTQIMGGSVTTEKLIAKKFAPDGKSELTLDWVRVNKADGSGTVWALCGV